MKTADRYHRFVRWSEADQLYIGGVCHRESEEAFYTELCGHIRDEIQQRGESLPESAVRVTRDVEMVAG